jgi:hypothetical protein
MFSSMEWMLLVLHRNMAFCLRNFFMNIPKFSAVPQITVHTYASILLPTFIFAENFLQHFRRKVHLQRKIFGSGISANFRKNSKRPQRDTVKASNFVRGH